MRRVAGRLAAASGSRPAGTFWPGTLPHPDLGRAPCCVEAGCLAGNKRRGGRERDARGGGWGSGEICVRRGSGGRDPERMCVRRGGGCRDPERRCVRRGSGGGDVRAPSQVQHHMDYSFFFYPIRSNPN